MFTKWLQEQEESVPLKENIPLDDILGSLPISWEYPNEVMEKPVYQRANTTIPMLINESIGFDPIIGETTSATASKMPPLKPLTENLAILNSMRRTGLLLRDEDIQEYYQQQVKTLMEKKSTLTLAQHKTNADILKAMYTWNESAHTNLEWALTALKDTINQLRAVNSAFY